MVMPNRGLLPDFGQKDTAPSPETTRYIPTGHTSFGTHLLEDDGHIVSTFHINLREGCIRLSRTEHHNNLKTKMYIVATIFWAFLMAISIISALAIRFYYLTDSAFEFGIGDQRVVSNTFSHIFCSNMEISSTQNFNVQRLSQNEQTWHKKRWSHVRYKLTKLSGNDHYYEHFNFNAGSTLNISACSNRNMMFYIIQSRRNFEMWQAHRCESCVLFQMVLHNTTLEGCLTGRHDPLQVEIIDSDTYYTVYYNPSAQVENSKKDNPQSISVLDHSRQVDNSKRDKTLNISMISNIRQENAAILYVKMEMDRVIYDVNTTLCQSVHYCKVELHPFQGDVILSENMGEDTQDSVAFIHTKCAHQPLMYAFFFFLNPLLFGIAATICIGRTHYRRHSVDSRAALGRNEETGQKGTKDVRVHYDMKRGEEATVFDLSESTPLLYSARVTLPGPSLYLNIGKILPYKQNRYSSV